MGQIKNTSLGRKYGNNNDDNKRLKTKEWWSLKAQPNTSSGKNIFPKTTHVHHSAIRGPTKDLLGFFFFARVLSFLFRSADRPDERLTCQQASEAKQKFRVYIGKYRTDKRKWQLTDEQSQDSDRRSSPKTHTLARMAQSSHQDSGTLLAVDTAPFCCHMCRTEHESPAIHLGLVAINWKESFAIYWSSTVK